MRCHFVLKALLLTIYCLSLSTSTPNIVKKQAVANCETNEDCLPASLQLNNINVSTEYVECQPETGACSCNDCFMLNNTDGTCYLNPPCTEYDNVTLQCIDNRQKTLTPFLLTFFLVITGAANFYIGRYEYAVPQLMFGVILLMCSCCFMPCVRAYGKKTKDNDESGRGCLACIVSIPYCLLCMAFIAWWIVDLVIFATNRRNDGNGCPLINNL